MCRGESCANNYQIILLIGHLCLTIYYGSMQFIGTSQANARADEANALGVQDLWTPENHYRWNKSRYSSHVSASVTAVREPRLFSQSRSLCI